MAFFASARETQSEPNQRLRGPGSELFGSKRQASRQAHNHNTLRVTTARRHLSSWTKALDDLESTIRATLDSAPDQPIPQDKLVSFVGISIGALTVKVVILRGGDVHARAMPHKGRPLQVLKEILARVEFAGSEYFGVSGHLGHLSEVRAIQRALHEWGQRVDAVVSLGGESFLVYTVADGRIAHVLSDNKCAAGSGEFFVQQIGRMGLGMEEAIRRSFSGTIVPLASRCSVHCKSDITHKLNRNEATPEDILRTLHESMANKVMALLEKGPGELRRVLLIGGVTQNAALLAALRQKRPATDFVVLPESSWFEAWGTALLTRDEPIHTSPKLSAPARFGQLPPLNCYGGGVQIGATLPPQPPPQLDMILGLDAGSTTTKAILVDPATRQIVASHYRRTLSDPVAAARECLRALVSQVGNRPVGLVGTTGSARELVGAYLGTEHVYNEISAQAAGAHFFNPDVDTIFEIGGQDSKYIRLRNGVPIDYAMNNACSAGTGSFLEESAQGDLGLNVAEIAEVALAAVAPVQFKATCAAFINSDIRMALQEGHSREDIVAGLVYAIASNYLNRVKGPRGVGRKVFLQGGVALNRAIGPAFARSVGVPVVIPPNPELLGALGVALLALQRCGGYLGTGREMLALAGPEMKVIGRLTCRACKMFCTLERFEVGGRRFPFGGRCSRYENVWKRKARTPAAPDLVEQRAQLLFGRTTAPPQDKARTIGIPRALTTHSLFPLYSTFVSGLGWTPVLSDMDPGGELKSYAGFCFPAQLAHGAVLDLERQGVGLVLVPQVMRMPQLNSSRDGFLCPITQAEPYFLAKAFPAIRFLTPLLDFANGYGTSSALADMAVQQLIVPRALADKAWAAAVLAQEEAERALGDLGRRALEQAVENGQPTVLLAGHSYNAFTPEASQSVAKKLSSMGVVAIPIDCLAPVGKGPTAWHFANQIMNAVALASEHPNLFLLCVTNFSCTIDAFTQAMFASELGSKPYLVLEIDAHTADAGVQTRLEAFLDIIRNYRAEPANGNSAFRPCRLGSKGQVTTSAGERVPLCDPRVKIYFPNFSPYHAQAMAMGTRWLGLRPGDVIPLARSQLDAGLRSTSGRECLPLPICIGQLLQVHERRTPGEIAGFFMLRGGAPCVVDCYMGYFERFIAEQRLPDLFLLNPAPDNDYLGLGKATMAQHLTPAILAGDLLVEIEQVLRVVGAPGTVEHFRQDWQRLATAANSLREFQRQLPAFLDRLGALPRTRTPSTCPRVVVTGDFFTRFSPFFMEGVTERYTEQGIILKPVDLIDLLLYGSYEAVAGTAQRWGMKPGGLACAKACTRIFQPDGQQYLRKWLSYQAERRAEHYYRRLFDTTGLLVAGPNNPCSLFESASEHVSPSIYGEIIPTIGKGLEAAREGYDGILLIGPFNCLPYRISEAILKPLSLQGGMPILSYESDGYPVTPSFLRQVEVHIQQVLSTSAKRVRP